MKTGKNYNYNIISIRLKKNRAREINKPEPTEGPVKLILTPKEIALTEPATVIESSTDPAQWKHEHSCYYIDPMLQINMKLLTNDHLGALLVPTVTRPSIIFSF